MHETPFTYDRRAVAGALTIAAAVAVLLVVLVGSLFLDDSQPGIVPVAPPIPAAPVEPAPLGPPTVLIPDNA